MFPATTTSIRTPSRERGLYGLGERERRQRRQSNTIWTTSVVSIGWGDWLEPLDRFADREEFREHLDEHFPERGAKRGAWQIWGFANEIQVGDLVVMPQKRPELGRRRLIAIGRVVGSYEYDPSRPEDMRKRRKVEWLQTDLPREVVKTT